MQRTIILVKRRVYEFKTDDTSSYYTFSGNSGWKPKTVFFGALPLLLVFEWDLINHTDTCIYAASKCLFCKELVNPEYFKSHITTQCERSDWVERNDKEPKVVISPSSIRVDAYFKHAISKVCEIQTIVSTMAFRTCKELPYSEEMASLPVDLRSVEFVQSSVNSEDEDSAFLASEDEFFNGIIQRPS
ncbi:hypothetical protein QVD99_003708 [Batrachochytrium dendrobatidis]|nr:hypothetical protein QVD99_003708 [Batrachochytrium dendrobatidis]